MWGSRWRPLHINILLFGYQICSSSEIMLSAYRTRQKRRDINTSNNRFYKCHHGADFYVNVKKRNFCGDQVKILQHSLSKRQQQCALCSEPNIVSLFSSQKYSLAQDKVMPMWTLCSYSGEEIERLYVHVINAIKTGLINSSRLKSVSLIVFY